MTNEEITENNSIQQDVVAAISELASLEQTPLNKHIQSKLYPIISRIAGVIEDIELDLQRPEEYLNESTVMLFGSLIEVVFVLLGRLAPFANENNPGMKEELQGIYQLTNQVKERLLEISEAGEEKDVSSGE